MSENLHTSFRIRNVCGKNWNSFTSTAISLLCNAIESYAFHTPSFRLHSFFRFSISESPEWWSALFCQTIRILCADANVCVPVCIDEILAYSTCSCAFILWVIAKESGSTPKTLVLFAWIRLHTSILPQRDGRCWQVALMKNRAVERCEVDGLALVPMLLVPHIVSRRPRYADVIRTHGIPAVFSSCCCCRRYRSYLAWSECASV